MTTKVHAVSANERLALCLTLSAGNCHDAPVGRELLKRERPKVETLAMDKAYEDDKTRALAESLDMKTSVPPKSNRKKKWQYDKKKYRRRNEVERMFGLMKENRRVATRYDKLDVTFISFWYLAQIAIALRDSSVNTA